MPSDIAISRLIASLDWWEYWGYWSVAAVAICCFGEYVHECTCWFRKFHWWNKNGGAASALLLVAALAAELAIQIETNSISGRVIAFLSDQAKQAELKTARLQMQVSWRQLTPEQATKLAEFAKSNPVKATFTTVQRDPEAQNFCNCSPG